MHCKKINATLGKIYLTMNARNEGTFLGHPIGLFVLFFTEMWERFSYYGMRAILVLYMASTLSDGGLGWTKASAIELYGWYTMLVYVMSIPGGIIADRLMGQKKSVMLGAIILVAGHGVLAIEAIWAFYTGLILIILGVGLLKPNISTMVGGLYKDGDIRRDKGFTIFYIGINIGAFLSALIVGYVGEKIGWHYGFGLAGIGMLLGLLVYIWGQKYLTHVGNFSGTTTDPAVKAAMNRPLNKTEKDRMIVLLLSFLIIIVFWGAFEQAGGLLNLYAAEKINLNLFGDWNMPASWFQSFNAGFIIIFGVLVANFWARRKRHGKESSTLLKMGIGTIIMGLGFVLMAGASKEAGAIEFGKASFWWLTGAYFLHTIGELCASPTALSFITKLAPVKYASIMMGVYFAATGLGNKLAGSIGEASQSEPIEISFQGTGEDLRGFERMDTLLAKDKPFTLQTDLFLDGDDIVTLDYKSKIRIGNIYNIDNKEQKKELKELLAENNSTASNPYHAKLHFEKDFEAKKVKENKGDGKNYAGTFIVEEIQNEREYRTFMFIFYLTLGFGLIIILFLKPLKRLTHGAEDKERDVALAEGYEYEAAAEDDYDS